MAFNARILADSLSPSGVRLTTFELTFPRVILAEFNTHRMISRNAASSRAIPTEKLIQRVIDDPFIPEFRENQKGMQAGESLAGSDAETAVGYWLEQRDAAVKMARELHELNVHKQYVNRLIEPWLWCTVIASATDWANLFHLRCSPLAEPSFRTVAEMALSEYRCSCPKSVAAGKWHLPLIFPEDEIFSTDYQIKLSVGRCARVSYLTHDGARDPAADAELHDRLAASGHWSPFEHQAQATSFINQRSGNLCGWTQYRKTFANENTVEFPEGNPS